MLTNTRPAAPRDDEPDVVELNPVVAEEMLDGDARLDPATFVGVLRGVPTSPAPAPGSPVPPST